MKGLSSMMKILATLIAALAIALIISIGGKTAFEYFSEIFGNATNQSYDPWENAKAVCATKCSICCTGPGSKEERTEKCEDEMRGESFKIDNETYTCADFGCECDA